ncbi:hypothetical protein A2690_04115 [Candidatus Roizmanbacteria bacterium RIFCSPHIGHO2_01_FULL_39_12b]|uniref:Dolichyl-phosphate beta-D-mannosyltransferase n=1 Tax=Candidatus Roizmanbacteria bacterium RIFCSPHIGHO2_01_FULL_39_12b TaxID=1802030 RepID=A0A1F7GCC1_9BACT|nr:MAG: hypothetical protein A2690_04115 [Candidatus Roizmanbacteria bacterium RIFCSPHIGHO2_01_FULL_39_12b]OGK47127.1 MAG: hypothetical protein A3B46_01840 [Candidatus Roizmanbacteria bacterium RIFCSPLOWO2_01_FULL_39_19]
MKRATIVLPTYNEKENIKILIPEIFTIAQYVQNWSISILVIDDTSPDGTADEVKLLQKKYKNLHLIVGPKLGLGNAYQRGFRYATDNLGPDFIFEMDADRQHNPNILPKFLKKIDEGAEFVIGSRYIKGGGIPESWAFYRKFFSYFGNWVLRLGFMKLSITDWTSGYRAIKTDFIDKTLPLYKKLNGYTFQIGILDNAIKNHLRIAEVPFYFEERGKGESKIKTLEFVVNNLLYIFFNSSFVKFAFVGVTGAVIDFCISFVLIEMFRLRVFFSTIISAETAIVTTFVFNNYWSFAHKKVAHKLNSFIRSFVKYNTVSAGNILIQAVLLEIATIIFPLKFWFVYKFIILAVVIIPYSYFMYNQVIWKQSPQKLANKE